MEIGSRSHVRRAPLGAAVAAGMFLLTACGTSSSSGGNAPAVAASTTAAAGAGCTLAKAGFQKVDLKSAKVGFSQSEKEDNPFRTAETKSMKDEAAKQGIELLATNAGSDLNKQINDIKDLLNQGAKVLIVAPLNSDGLQPAFAAAKAKGVPIVTVDRKVNMTACTDYLTFIGSDFVSQGMKAADAMAKALNNKGNVAILLGSSGNNVTTQRTSGFVDEIAKAAPGIKIVAQQTGEFNRDKGNQVMAQLIQAHPEINGVYGENDEMALGAAAALTAAGKTPGKAVQIVSIDGTKNAVQKIVDGQFYAVVESNPRMGPLAFSAAMKFESGEGVPDAIVISDKFYDSSNATAEVATAY